ncbi:hypothetical protein LguiB_028654 [Lonicera macranthoides]
MIEYMESLDKLGLKIFEMLARGLGLEDDFFTKNFEVKEETIIRINRYPPCPLPEKCLGLGSHSDPHTLTILLQDEAWTNGKLRSNVHRAVVNKEKRRLSVAYFMSPTSNAIIECPPQLMDPHKNPKNISANVCPARVALLRFASCPSRSSMILSTPDNFAGKPHSCDQTSPKIRDMREERDGFSIMGGDATM